MLRRLAIIILSERPLVQFPLTYFLPVLSAHRTHTGGNSHTHAQMATQRYTNVHVRPIYGHAQKGEGGRDRITQLELAVLTPLVAGFPVQCSSICARSFSPLPPPLSLFVPCLSLSLSLSLSFSLSGCVFVCVCVCGSMCVHVCVCHPA
jgi:hypothetical protein